MDIARDAVKQVKMLTDKSFYNPMSCKLSVFKCKPVTYYIVAMIVILMFLFIAYATKSSRTVLLVSTACHLLIFVLCSLILMNLCNSDSSEYYSYAAIIASAIMTGLIVFIFNIRKTTTKQIPVNKPVDKPADKPADKPTDKPADKPTDKPADKPTDKLNCPTGCVAAKQ
jgi:hypothetical protein